LALEEAVEGAEEDEVSLEEDEEAPLDQADRERCRFPDLDRRFWFWFWFWFCLLLLVLEAFLNGKNDISGELVFQSPEGKILDPDNLYHRIFLPALAKAGIRRIRLHDLRHTFGSLLIQNGASIVYVKEQMGHSSIQVTVDIYGHLIPGANVCFVDRMDGVMAEEAKTSPQQPATPAQQREMEVPPDLLQVVEGIGGGGRTRTYDLRIMRPSL
jgi:hypothetical protein